MSPFHEGRAPERCSLSTDHLDAVERRLRTWLWTLAHVRLAPLSGARPDRPRNGEQARTTCLAMTVESVR